MDHIYEKWRASVLSIAQDLENLIGPHFNREAFLKDSRKAFLSACGYEENLPPGGI